MGIDKILEIDPSLLERDESLIVFDLPSMLELPPVQPKSASWHKPAVRKEVKYPPFNPNAQPYIGQRVQVEEGPGIVMVIKTASGAYGAAAIELIGSKKPVVKDYSLRPEQ